jgi:cytochrome c
MESLEFNKIAGAVLATGLLVLGLKNLSAEVFHSELPEKPGFEIVVAEANAATPDSATPAVAVPIAQLLAKADIAKGMASAKACAACHSFDKGGANKVGPHLWDIVGRPMGSAEGFAYSDAFKAMGAKPWDFDALNSWLLAPKEMIKGTKMSFSGLKKDETRANVIAYLASLSDAPKPLPKP